MGNPNWKRLAELGQLPEHAKEMLPQSFNEANAYSIIKKKEEVEGEIKDEKEKIEEIESFIMNEKRSKYINLTNRELRQICEDNKIDNTGNKDELVSRIVAFNDSKANTNGLQKEEEIKEEIETGEEVAKNEEIEEEKIGEFIDPLIK